MDGDGELQRGDDVNASLPCASESSDRHSGSTVKDTRESSASDSNNNGCGGEDDDDDGGENSSVDKDDDDDDDDDDNDDDDDDEDDDGEEEEEGYERGEEGEDDGSDDSEDRMLIDIPEEAEGEEDDRDSTDGGPPAAHSVSGAALEPRVTTEKRVPVQSQRMRDYQAMQQTPSSSSRARKCPWCGRVLYSGPGYRYHLTTHHEGKESFTCDMCRKKFKSLNGLKYHRKRKRCKGIGISPVSVPSDTAISAPALTAISDNTATLQTSSTTFEEEFHAQRLMELAKIATSPQSPLLQSPGPDSRGGMARSFFDDSEASAVMALSNMKRSSESRKSSEACCSSNTPHLSSQLQQPQQQQQQHPPTQDVKSKRPMNGFMLFAQQHRAEFKKKFPTINNRMISTKLSEEWSRLPEKERQRWKDEARHKAEIQLKEHPDCWKRKK